MKALDLFKPIELMERFLLQVSIHELAVKSGDRLRSGHMPIHKQHQHPSRRKHVELPITTGEFVGSLRLALPLLYAGLQELDGMCCEEIFYWRKLPLG